MGKKEDEPKKEDETKTRPIPKREDLFICTARHQLFRMRTSAVLLNRTRRGQLNKRYLAKITPNDRITSAGVLKLDIPPIVIKDSPSPKVEDVKMESGDDDDDDER